MQELIRVNMIASNMPISFWPCAAQHAVDVLNRTTSPPDSDLTCYEEFIGSKPKIMGILPFGCRAFVVKPKEYIRKIAIDAHT